MTQSAPPVSRLLSLTGQTVLITGAGGNIGGGIARRLAEAGADIIAHHRDSPAKVDVLISDIVALGRQAVAVQADLRSETDITEMLRQAADAGITAVVNNAAVQPVRALAEMSAAEWREVVAANLDGAFLVAKLAAQSMRASGGAIVNIASIEGSDPAAGHAHYSASKAGLIMLTRSLALEFGRDGVRANAVSPGLIDRDSLATDWPGGVERWRAHAPLSRLGTVTDVADAVLFLLSPAARWISGINLVVDGGMSSVPRW